MNRNLFILVLGLWLGCGLPSIWATLDDGLIGYWPLDGDALDYSGNDHHGTILPGASFTLSPTADRSVLQAIMDGIDRGHVLIGLPSSYHPGTDRVDFMTSGSVWVMFDDRLGLANAADAQGIVGNPPGMLYVDRVLNTNNLRTMVRRVEQDGTNKGFWPTSTRNSIALENKWYHVAWTFQPHYRGDDGHFRWYINGILINQYAAGVQTIGSSIFRIGGSHGRYSNNAKLAEVRLYDRILSAEEVLELSREPGFHPRGHYPLWWEMYGVINTALVADDYAAVNQGQLKHVATQAAEYLDDALRVIGGSGTDIKSIVALWQTPSPDADDYAAANLGQLKFVSAKFYDRLNEVLFDQWPDGMNIDSTTGYPWPQTSDSSDDYALSNQGQLKFLFSWNPAAWLRADGNGDGLPDWLQQYMLSLNPDGDVSPGGDFDGDGVSNLDEYLNGGLVADFYNGSAASYSLEILTDPIVIGQSGSVANDPLRIIVRDSEGIPVPNAPLYLMPEMLGALFGIDTNGEGFTASLIAFTDANGVATIYVKP